MKKTFKTLLAISVATALYLPGTAALAGSGANAKVRLVATINDGPAFQPVKWEVYRLGDPEKKVYTSNRHTFTLRLKEPGRYKAIAKRTNGKTRERNFYVMADTNNRVHIPVD